MKRNRIFGVALVMTCLAIGASTALATLRTPRVQASSAPQSTRPTRSLRKAVLRGEVERVRTLIASGSDVNAIDGEGRTPLHYAAQGGSTPIVEQLLDAGASLDIADRSGLTPTLLALNAHRREIVEMLVGHDAEVTPYIAAYLGDVETLENLLEAGIDPNATNQAEHTPLHLALEQEHYHIAKLLIAHNANINAASSYGSTPLFPASANGADEIVRMLLQRGANVNVADKGGRTALHMAARWGHLDIVELLVEQGADVNPQTTLTYYERGPSMRSRRVPPGWTPLQAAADGGHEDIMRFLIASGATASLWQAVQTGSTEALQTLIADGADVNIRRAGTDDTLLHEAVRYGHMDTVMLLLDNGANPNARSERGQTALHHAARYGYPRIATLLLEHDALVNATDESGATALHEAAFYGHTSVAELLMASGADPNASTQPIRPPGRVPPPGKTPMDYAREAGFADMVAVLGGDPDDPALAKAGPRTVIITNAQNVREFLRWKKIDFADVWVPTQADIEGLDTSLRAFLEANRTIDTKMHFDREFVLAHLRRYNREYGGFIEGGRRKIICQMHLMRGNMMVVHRANQFHRICDGGSCVVRIVFDAQTKTVIEIDCNVEV